jgi:hypothetical protein
MNKNGFTNDSLRPSLRLIDSIERLQALSRLNESDWLDLMNVSWAEYDSFRAGLDRLPYAAFEKVADYFELATVDLFIHKIDFRDIAQRQTPRHARLPDRFLAGAYGRLRSTIGAIESLEKNYGWRLKHDVLRQFQLFEPSLMNPFAPVSIRLMTEICEYLHHRQFSERDFFNMGTYAYDSDRESLIGSIYRELTNFREAFKVFATVLMPLFGQNCSYGFQMKDEHTGVLVMRSNPDIAAELRLKVLGSPHICQVKAGSWASLLFYFQMTLPQVTHPECEHRGDAACKFVFDFSNCQNLSEP